jgi:hypothetical protein
MGPLGDILHDRVAMPVAVGEGDQDMEGVPMKRKKTFRLGIDLSCASCRSHGGSIPLLAIADKVILQCLPRLVRYWL